MKYFGQERKVLPRFETRNAIGWKRTVQLYYVLLTMLVISLVGVSYLSGEDLGISRNLTMHKGKQKKQPLLFHFVHTTDEASFHKRCVRAVESVFFHHPNANVMIHVPDDGATIGLQTDMTEKPFLPLINAGYNVTIQRFQLKPLLETALRQGGSTVRRSLAEKWMKTQILPNVLGKNWHVDISDLVRLLVLYTKGGVYLDTDVIVVKPLDELPDSIGFERPDGPNNAVLKFSTPGNLFVADCLNEYFSRFRSSTFSWGFVGPRLLKRVYKQKYPFCQVPTYSSESDVPQNPSCAVLILWKDAFYPDIEGCLASEAHAKSKQLSIQEKSFVVHTYNTRMKQELATVDVSTLGEKDTLCNWLYNSFCLFCSENVWV